MRAVAAHPKRFIESASDAVRGAMLYWPLVEEKPKAQLKEIFGWCMFDFANSSFTTVIVTVVFSVYFTKIVCSGRPDADQLWGYAGFISQGVVLIAAPFLGALADFSGAKKKFLTITWLCCCVFTGLLSLVGPGDVWLGILMFVLANMFYSAGENFNASFLPELATAENMGKVSGYGWALGYFGGLLALVVCMPLLRPGMDAANAQNLRYTSLVTGLFFFLAGLPTLFFLKERGVAQQLPPGHTYFSISLARLKETLQQVRQFRQLFRFFFVFATYNMGLCAIVAFASIFTEKTLHFNGMELIQFFAQLQITAALGAFTLGFFQDRFGAKSALGLSLIIWILASLGCWKVQDKDSFFWVANLAGVALGSSQSGARALVALLSPETRSAEFFGFWGLFWKLSNALGPLAFGMMATWWDQRTAALGNGMFFVLGLIGLMFVDVDEGRKAALAAEADDKAKMAVS
jgi:UMF1 family MFS transporter